MPRSLGIAAVVLACGAAVALGGCGSSVKSTPAATRLEREDFAMVGRALASVRASVDGEVAATKQAWPLISSGLPQAPDQATLRAIAHARELAARMRLPALFGEAPAATLTGPASHLAGLFRSFNGLATRGWQQIDAAATQSEPGSPAARFALANVALYIESVYDGHFGLAQIGKQVRAGYEQLGGASAFGRSLTESEVEQLEGGYSEANDRLHPHVRARLGS